MRMRSAGSTVASVNVSDIKCEPDDGFLGGASFPEGCVGMEDVKPTLSEIVPATEYSVATTSEHVDQDDKSLCPNQPIDIQMEHMKSVHASQLFSNDCYQPTTSNDVKPCVDDTSLEHDDPSSEDEEETVQSRERQRVKCKRSSTGRPSAIGPAQKKLKKIAISKTDQVLMDMDEVDTCIRKANKLSQEQPEIEIITVDLNECIPSGSLRPVNSDHVQALKQLYKEKVMSAADLTLTGVKSGRVYTVHDGQHRLTALKELNRECEDAGLEKFHNGTVRMRIPQDHTESTAKQCALRTVRAGVNGRKFTLVERLSLIELHRESIGLTDEIMKKCSKEQQRICITDFFESRQQDGLEKTEAELDYPAWLIQLSMLESSVKESVKKLMKMGEEGHLKGCKKTNSNVKFFDSFIRCHQRKSADAAVRIINSVIEGTITVEEGQKELHKIPYNSRELLEQRKFTSQEIEAIIDKLGEHSSAIIRKIPFRGRMKVATFLSKAAAIICPPGAVTVRYVDKATDTCDSDGLLIVSRTGESSLRHAIQKLTADFICILLGDDPSTLSFLTEKKIPLLRLILDRPDPTPTQNGRIGNTHFIIHLLIRRAGTWLTEKDVVEMSASNGGLFCDRINCDVINKLCSSLKVKKVTFCCDTLFEGVCMQIAPSMERIQVIEKEDWLVEKLLLKFPHLRK